VNLKGETETVGESAGMGERNEKEFLKEFSKFRCWGFDWREFLFNW
jgi:hypothetical protein